MKFWDLVALVIATAILIGGIVYQLGIGHLIR